MYYSVSNLWFRAQVRKDGTRMSLAQSKKLSQITADNHQWEERQLLRSGAVRGTELSTEFDDEEEHKVILLVHGKGKPHDRHFQSTNASVSDFTCTDDCNIIS